MVQNPQNSHQRTGVTFAAELSFEDIHLYYGDVHTLKGISLKASPGEILCLLGPSGSGKTSLLRLAAGLEHQSSGRVLTNGREIASDTEESGGSAMFDVARSTFVEAWKTYQRAAALAPHEPRIINDTALIQIYHLQDDLDGAERMLRRAIDVGERQLEEMGEFAEERLYFKPAAWYEDNNVELILSKEDKMKFSIVTNEPEGRLRSWLPNDLQAEEVVFLPDVCPGKSPLPTGTAVFTKQPDWRRFAVVAYAGHL